MTEMKCGECGHVPDPGSGETSCVVCGGPIRPWCERHHRFLESRPCSLCVAVDSSPASSSPVSSGSRESAGSRSGAGRTGGRASPPIPALLHVSPPPVALPSTSRPPVSRPPEPAPVLPSGSARDTAYVVVGAAAMWLILYGMSYFGRVSYRSGAGPHGSAAWLWGKAILSLSACLVYALAYIPSHWPISGKALTCLIILVLLPVSLVLAGGITSFLPGLLLAVVGTVVVELGLAIGTSKG